MRWQDHITSTPDVLKGLVLGYLANGADTKDIQREFPDVKPEDVTACLSCARDLADSPGGLTFNRRGRIL
ncbi:MAG: hypothetical protein BRD46_03625 [Bacteroidetes bacterium QS_8_68_15]|nr:MAG: hypothetical protein BRD46_03625 [Bacteroidetes bacterium QS_8_68_15]